MRTLIVGSRANGGNAVIAIGRLPDEIVEAWRPKSALGSGRDYPLLRSVHAIARSGIDR